MLNDAETRRYLRHILLKEIGAQGQQKLRAARIGVVGAGGIGAPALLYVAAAGVGRLRVVDPDTVDLSNLQRQILYGVADVDAGKASAAADALARLNPDVAVEPVAARLDAATAAAFVDGCDVVLEGVDNFETRYVVNAACIKAGVPLVSAAVGRFDGQIAVFHPTDAPGVNPCYRCFAPEAPPREAALVCAEEGVLGPVTGVVGAQAALEALKLIAGFGEPLIGALAVYDGLTGAMRRIILPADPACPDCSSLAGRAAADAL